MTVSEDLPPPGYRYVYSKYITNRHTGRRIYNKNGKCFRFLVKI
ncbi:hypothetical protein C7967_10499 [Thalassospira sp. 11-3]|jgi:hypothetical protein|nr:hypothetical protein KO164_1845 [Thalassospira sp. KO164]PXX32620.1 hypothetical protein C7967_10499 [Thalassospira sp. 11-3]SEE18404.1 hypothetical protein SAMN04515623_1858 [Thalassospira permensis]